MVKRSVSLGLVLDRLLFQHARVKVLHVLFLAIAGFSFILSHAETANPYGRGIGVLLVVSAFAAWWPIVLSWFLTRSPNETRATFVTWQILFCVVNLAVAGIHATQYPAKFADSPWMLSVAHAVLLVAITPLAIEAATNSDESQ